MSNVVGSEATHHLLVLHLAMALGEVEAAQDLQSLQDLAVQKSARLPPFAVGVRFMENTKATPMSLREVAVWSTLVEMIVAVVGDDVPGKPPRVVVFAGAHRERVRVRRHRHPLLGSCQRSQEMLRLRTISRRIALEVRNAALLECHSPQSCTVTDISLFHLVLSRTLFVGGVTYVPCISSNKRQANVGK
jgi:hypothetical protein